MKHMKIILTMLCLIACMFAHAGDPPKVDNPIEISAFYVANTDNLNDFQEGVGVGLTYWLSPNIGIGGDAISYLPNGEWYGAAHDANVDEVNISLTGKLPLANSNFNLLGLVGGGNNFEEHEWRLNVGGGLGYQWNRLSASALVLWVNDFDNLGHAQLRGGIGFRF
jgi:hypothetical protein